VLGQYREIILIAAVALLSALLAQSPLVSGVPAFLVGALGPALLPAALLYRRRSGRRARTYAFFQRLIDDLPDAFYVKDENSRYVMVNQAFTRERGRTFEEVIGRSTSEVMAERAPEAIASDRAALQGELFSTEQLVIHPVTGIEHFRVVTKRRVENEWGLPLVVCYHHDITRWKVAERSLQGALGRETELRKRTQTFVQRLIDVIPDPFYVKSAAGRFIIVNEAHAREKQTPKEELVAFDSYVLESDEAAAEARKEDRAVIAGAELDKEEHSGAPGTGGERFRRVVKRRSEHIDGSPVVVGAHFDITRWKIAERELERVAYEDSLTGLANRRHFLAEAERAAARADRHGQALSLLLFDLDHFKRINDEHGHQAGDEVLIEVAQRTRKSLRVEDMPARWGGEEFVALLPMTALSAASLVGNRLRLAIAAAPIATSVLLLPVTCSCGIAQRRRAEPILEFIARADAALYQAKNAGRNACALAPMD
jgi:diguanylate cyclase (GGDEF)-like protein/PAS domain S-box-containing protein